MKLPRCVLLICLSLALGASVGAAAATRLQWGASYVRALADLAPQSIERIERAAGSVIADIEPKPETFYQRIRAVLDRMATKLAEWNRDGQHNEAMARLRTQMDGVCDRLPPATPEQHYCEGVLPARAPQ
jgi:hypothetical protein